MAADQPSLNRYRKSKRGIAIPDRVAERAATKWDMDDDGCWISTYALMSSGYAQISWKESGKNYSSSAHRAAWVYFHGEQIPEGMTVDHLCKSKRCVNPGHMRLITNFENARRTRGRDWKIGECANGHPNSELFWDGWQYRCRPCRLAERRRQQRRYREKKRQERSA